MASFRRSILVACALSTCAGLLVSPSAQAGEDLSSSASQVRVVRGFGKRVVTVSIARRDPIVVTGTHTGGENFIVHLVRGGSTDYIFNEIGRYTGQAVVEEATPVNIVSSWTLMVLGH